METPHLKYLKYLDLSTAHITKEDSEMLSDHDECHRGGLVVYDYEYGFFIPVCDELDGVQIRQAGFSDALAYIVELCQEQKIDLIRLDCDGEEIEGLPTFEW